MPTRVKNIISLLLVVAVAYFLYTMMKEHRRTSHSHLLHDTVASHRPSDSDPQWNQGQAVAVSANGAPLDVRSNKCRRQRYSDIERLTATIIVDLPGEGVDVKQFYSTIDSLLTGAQALVDEVIVVAAGLNGPTATQLDSYLASLAVTARLIRNAGAGQASSRVAGAKVAKSPVVVFADWRVMGTVGWLRPLLGTLAVEPNSIVVPHLDDASDPAALTTTPERLSAEYAWPLSVRMMELEDAVPTSEGLYRSSVLRGDLFAVRRDFWDQLGGYDQALGADSAAANVEMSIRAWQCRSSEDTGSILMNPCSHVGVRNLREIIRVVEPSSVKRIAQLWFGDLQAILTRGYGLSVNPEDERPAGRAAECRGIKSYFSDIANHVPVPSTQAIHFGQLRAHSGKLYVVARCHYSRYTNCRTKSTNELADLVKKVLPEPHGSSGGADLRFHIPQPDTSLRCQTTDMGLVHRAVCLFTPQPKPVPIYTAW